MLQFPDARVPLLFEILEARHKETVSEENNLEVGRLMVKRRPPLGAAVSGSNFPPLRTLPLCLSYLMMSKQRPGTPARLPWPERCIIKACRINTAHTPSSSAVCQIISNPPAGRIERHLGAGLAIPYSMLSAQRSTFNSPCPHRQSRSVILPLRVTTNTSSLRSPSSSCRSHGTAS